MKKPKIFPVSLNAWGEEDWIIDPWVPGSWESKDEEVLSKFIPNQDCDYLLPPRAYGENCYLLRVPSSTVLEGEFLTLKQHIAIENKEGTLIFLYPEKNLFHNIISQVDIIDRRFKGKIGFSRKGINLHFNFSKG